MGRVSDLRLIGLNKIRMKPRRNPAEAPPSPRVEPAQDQRYRSRDPKRGHLKVYLGQAVEEIYREFGRVYYDRIDFHTTEKIKKSILASCARGVRRLGGHAVRSTETMDGYKFRIEGGWLLIRASGTEPLLRFYAEADTEKKVRDLLRAAAHLQTSGRKS